MSQQRRVDLPERQWFGERKLFAGEVYKLATDENKVGAFLEFLSKMTILYNL